MTTMEEAVDIAHLIRERLDELNEIGKRAAGMGISVTYQADEAAPTKGPQVPRYELKAQITIEL